MNMTKYWDCLLSNRPVFWTLTLS